MCDYITPCRYETLEQTRHRTTNYLNTTYIHRAGIPRPAHTSKLRKYILHIHFWYFYDFLGTYCKNKYRRCQSSLYFHRHMSVSHTREHNPCDQSSADQSHLHMVRWQPDEDMYAPHVPYFPKLIFIYCFLLYCIVIFL